MSDEKIRQMALEKERSAMRQAANFEQFSLADEFSKTNARIHLLATSSVISQYLEASSSLEHWSRLHSQATPRYMKNLGEGIVMVQVAPDPTLPFKEPGSPLQAPNLMFTSILAMAYT